MSTNDAKPLILCVDDEVIQLRVLKGWLTHFGYDVLTAESGEQALETIQQTKPDCLILDIMMPGMDGYKVCARLQENEDTAQIPVIFVTGLGDAHDKARAFALGAVDYVEKPFDEQTFHDKVRACLQATPRWQALQQRAAPQPQRSKPEDFWHFRDFLFLYLKLPPEKQEELRQRFRQAGRRTVETRYSFARRMDRLRSCYDDLLGPQTGRAEFTARCL